MILRPLQIDDVFNLVGVATENKNLLQYSQTPIYSEDLLRTYIAKAIGDRQNKVRYPFSIFDKTKKKDDLADTLCQIEAICVLWKLPLTTHQIVKNKIVLNIIK